MVVCMILLGAIGWFLSEILRYAELKCTLWKNGAKADD